MRRVMRENGLSVALLALFLLSVGGQILAGWGADSAEHRQHGAPTLALSAYLGSGHFVSAVFENWESEFLQMGAYTC